MMNCPAYERDCSRLVVQNLTLGALIIIVSEVVGQTSDGDTYLRSLVCSCSY